MGAARIGYSIRFGRIRDTRIGYSDRVPADFEMFEPVSCASCIYTVRLHRLVPCSEGELDVAGVCVPKIAGAFD